MYFRVPLKLFRICFLWGRSTVIWERHCFHCAINWIVMLPWKSEGYVIGIIKLYRKIWLYFTFSFLLEGAYKTELSTDWNVRSGESIPLKPLSEISPPEKNLMTSFSISSPQFLLRSICSKVSLVSAPQSFSCVGTPAYGVYNDTKYEVRTFKWKYKLIWFYYTQIAKSILSLTNMLISVDDLIGSSINVIKFRSDGLSPEIKQTLGKKFSFHRVWHMIWRPYNTLCKTDRFSTFV